ncbi:MAG: acyltransferase family protein [Lachnospiraceae bacterium]|nr:acyltransferase family protein [Lachnospiraceae bacterium]
MNEIKADTGGRMAVWDNAKAMLILLVVLGHALYSLLEVAEIYQALYFFIYLFHMPLFMYISGLFSRRTIQTGAKLRQKVLGYVMLGVILKLILLLVRLIFNQFTYRSTSFSLFRETSVPWYLLVLAAYLVVTRLIKDVAPRFLLILSVVLACLAGYDRYVGEWFLVSRFLVYYPFFLAGAFFSADRLAAWGKGIVPKAAAAVFLAVLFVLVYRYIGILHPFRELIKGGTCYYDLHKEIGKDQVLMCGLYRLFYYIVSALMCTALMWLMPAGEHSFTEVGRNTLSVYMLHRPIQLMFVYGGLSLLLVDPAQTKIRLLYLLASPVLVYLLSLPGWRSASDLFWKQLKNV